ncbi:MAG: C25 family cysteine peptidase [Chitinophagales bacterium]|nr:gliding motility-associated C-terminal domain-containing protein [Bacteroidota bacterium]MCB9042513.1 gliding motility-associated C-terminal domain-containing protein [Chitinophagales bacterium]
MIKLRILFTWTCLLMSFGVFAQSYGYGNNWIDYGNTYYQFEIKETGVYRISYSTLQSMGIPLVGANFRLYGRGAEVPIYVSTSGTFGASDYIEFYAEENDGYFDTQIFVSPTDHMNPYKSLFTKKSSYFLTVTNGPNKRYVQSLVDISGTNTPEPYFWYESLLSLSTQFNYGVGHKDPTGVISYFGLYEKGEGRASSTINTDQPTPLLSTFGVNTPYRYTAGNLEATVNMRLVGTSEAILAVPNHFFKVISNSKTFYNGSSFRYDLSNVAFNMNISDMSDATSFYIEPRDSVMTIANTNFNLETNIRLSYIKVKYPRQFNFGNATSFEFTIDASTEKYIEISNFNGGTSPILYDKTTQRRMTPVVENGKYKFKISPIAGAPNEHKMLILNSSEISYISSSAIAPMNFTNYANTANQGNYVIITHPSLEAGAVDYVNQYKQYRESALGGGYDVVVVNIEELYMQFSHGIRKHPLSVRNFINYAMDKWSVKPTHVLLLGKSIEYDTMNESDNVNLNNFEKCLIPTWGHQPSDVSLAAPSNYDYRPRVAIGRVPAKTPAEVRAYLDKLKEYEAWFVTDCNDLSDREWMQRALHIAKGFNTTEMNKYLEDLDSYTAHQTSTPASMEIVNTFQASNLGGTTPSPLFSTYLTQGLGVINYSGHAGVPTSEYWSYTVGQCSQYNNEGKYPMIISNSCFIGQIHRQNATSMAENWVLTDNRGCIGLLATIALSFPDYLQQYTEVLSEHLYNSHYGETIGEAMKHTIEDIYTPPTNQYGEGVTVTSLEFTWAGDPAIRPYSWKNPEYVLSNVSSSPNLNQPTVNLSCDDIEVSFTLENLGKVSGDVTITITRVLPDGTEMVEINQTVATPDRSKNYTFSLPPRLDVGLGSNDFIIEINAGQTVTEDCYNNNTFTYSNVNIASGGGSTVNVQIQNLDNTYCEDDGDITLQANVSGGTFTVNGQTATKFKPSTLGPGDYTVTYTYDDNGCTLSTSELVTVASLPSADFDFSIEATCVGNNIIFEYNGNTNNLNFNWNFGNAASNPTSTFAGPHTINYSTAGTKNIVLTVTNSAGCQRQVTQQVEVYSQLTAPQPLCVNQTDNSLQIEWNTVTGATSYLVVTGTNTTTVTGNTFTLNNLNQGDEVVFNVYALGEIDCANSGVGSTSCVAEACPAIAISINALDESYCYGADAVNLIGSPAGGTFKVDGVTTNSLNPSALTPGEHTISYTIFQQETDCTYSTETTVQINPPLTLNIASSNNNICPGTSVILSSDLGGNVTWNGPGLSDYVGSTVEITPTENATYTAIASNSEGCISEGSIEITVSLDALPIADFGVNANTICPGETLNLINASINATTSTWEITDQQGQTNTYIDANPSVVFEEPGLYSVKLTVEGCGNNTDVLEVSDFIEVITTPDIEIEGLHAVCPGEELTLNIATGSLFDVVWSTEGVNDVAANEISFTPTQNGQVHVSASNASGCSASKAFLVEVYEVTPLSITNDTIVCPGTPVQINADGAVSYTWSPANVLDNANVSNPIITTETDVTLNVEAVDANGCGKTGDFVLSVDEELCEVVELSVPNTITPNGDNYNESWVIQGLENYPNHRIEIYNRWGMLIYEASPYNNDWKGTSEGKDLPDGTYYYLLYLDRDATPQTGTITLMK